MNTSTEGGIVLNSLEVHALAIRVIARLLADYEIWLEWEDFPLLSEGSFEDLVGEVANQSRNWWERSSQFDRAHDIDSAHILEATS